jgi:D-arabinose 1-dehydrogenase-like Zn-dependent alcohol dehydrogenase
MLLSIFRKTLGSSLAQTRVIRSMSSSAGRMRAIVLEDTNMAMRLQHLRMPVPKAGEVLVKTHAVGVCHSDLSVAKGKVRFPVPCVLGHEMTGTVVEVNEANSNLRTASSV